MARRDWQLLRKSPRPRLQPTTWPFTPTTIPTPTTTVQRRKRRTLAVIQGFFLPKVGTLSSPLPGLAFSEKFLQNYLLTHFLMCIYVSSEEAKESKRKQKICLVLLKYMQKLKKPIDFLKKRCVQKIGSRSARFKRLADTQNICIVYQNEPSIKKLLVRTKIAV